MQLENVFGHRPEVRSFQESSRFVLPSCCIGIEIELERPSDYLLDHAFTYWRRTGDGSLRDGGFELVLAQPLAGRDLEQALREVNEMLTSDHCVFSERTSVHIHLDVRDLNLDQLFNLFMMYVIFERSMFKLLDNGRENNIFCVPIYAGEGGWRQFASQLFNRYLPDDDPRGMRARSVRNLQKYSALNVLALSSFGSLEFRHMEGTGDMDRLTWWINILMSLKLKAKEMQFGPLEFLSSLSESGPDSMAEDIFSVEDARYLIQSIDFMDDVFEGIRLAQDFIHVSDRQRSGLWKKVRSLQEFDREQNVSTTFNNWYKTVTKDKIDLNSELVDKYKSAGQAPSNLKYGTILNTLEELMNGFRDQEAVKLFDEVYEQMIEEQTGNAKRRKKSSFEDGRINIRQNFEPLPEVELDDDDDDMEEDED